MKIPMLSSQAKQDIEKHIAGLPAELRPEPATEELLSEFESKHGSIPPDYRWLLAICGRGDFGSYRVDDIYNLAASHAKFTREFGPPCGWSLRDVFIIGWNRSGNPFGIETSTGRVLVDDYNSGEIHELAPSFEEFLLKGIGK